MELNYFVSKNVNDDISVENNYKHLLVTIRGLQGSMEEAIKIAVEEIDKGSVDFIELAIKIVNTSTYVSLKKRLWLLIIKSVWRLGEDKLRELLKRKDCPLRMGDLVESLGDEFQAENFSQVK